MKIIFNVLISIIIFFCSAFSQNINYYPLKIGNEWKYQLANGDWQKKIIVTSYDENYEAFLLTEINKLGTTLPETNQTLMENRNGNIIQLGTQSGFLNTDWQYESSIVLSNDLSVGSKWYYEYDEMNEQVVADTLTVAVKAGLFVNVLKIEKYLMRYNKKLKKKEISIELFDYYAPNVGLIKECFYDLEKKVESIFMELVDYKVY